jgi:hypothetical protein
MVHFFTVLIDSESDSGELREVIEQALWRFSDRVAVYEPLDDDEPEDAADEGFDPFELADYDFNDARDDGAEEAEADDGS